MVGYDDMGEENNEGTNTKFYALLLSVVLATVGGNLGYRTISDPRPDPFTGTNGRELEARLEKRIEYLEKQMDANERDADEWKYRIIKLENGK